MNLNLLIAVDEIVKYIDIGLLGLFVLVIIAFIVAAIVGYKRGIYRTTFGFIYMALMIGGALLTLEPLVNFIGEFDLSSILPFKTIVITNESTGASFFVPITSVFETLNNSFLGLFTLYNIEGDATVLLALTSSVLKYAVFFVQIVLILTLGALFGVILWSLCFKHLIPKIARRKAKLKIVSMCMKSVQFVVVTALFFSPISSLINTANSIYQNSKDNENSGIPSEIGTFLDTYNNSIFAQAFFNWTMNDDGLTLDMQIMNEITSATVNGVSVSLYDEINNIGNAASTLMNGIIFDFDGSSSPVIDYSYFVSTEAVDALFSLIQNSNIIMLVLPMATTFAINLPILEEYIDPNLLNLDDFEWSNAEIDVIHTMMNDVVHSGIIDNFFDLETGQIKETIVVDDLLNSMFDPESYNYILRILRSIDDSTLLSRALPSVLYSLLQMEQMSEMTSYLPSSFDELNDIQWGFELSIVYDTIYQMNAVDNRLLPALLKSFDQDENTPSNKKSSNNSEENEGDNDVDMIQIVIDNLSVYRDLLLGPTDSTGNLLNVDGNGYSIVHDKDGNQIAGRRYNLFDLKLMNSLLPPLVDMLSESLSSLDGEIQIDTEALNDAVDELYDGKPVKNFKLEFHRVFDCLQALSANGQIIDVINSGGQIIPEGGNIIDIDPELIDSICIALPKIDDSKILSSVVFPLLENMLLDEESSKYLEEVGLDPTSFDFSIDGTGYELSKFLSTFDDLAVLLDAIEKAGDDTNLLIESLSGNSESIANILDAVYDCKVINPTEDKDNFFSLLEFVFSQTNQEGLNFKKDELKALDLKWTNTRDSNGELYKDKNANPIFDGENGYFTNVIKSVGESGILEIAQPGFDIGENIGELESEYHVSDFIKTAAKSSIFRLTLGDFFDATLEETGLLDVENNITFTNVTDWEKEADILGKILLGIDKLEIDLQNFNITQVRDVVTLNDTLHALSDSGIFTDKNGNYLLSSFLFDKIKTGFSQSDIDLLKDPDDGSGVVTYTEAESDFLKLDEKTDWNIDNYEYDFDTSKYVKGEYIHYYDNPQFALDYQEYFTQDEIGRIVKVIFNLKDVDLDNILSTSKETIFETLHAVNDTQTLRMGIYNLYEVVGQEVNTRGDIIEFVDFDLANNEYLIDCSKQERDYEIDLLERVYELYDLLSQDKYQGVFTGRFNLSLVDENMIVTLEDSLKAINESYVYHRAGPVENNDITLFQDSIISLLSSDEFKPYYYSENSPKDVKLGLIDGNYTSVDEKALYNVKAIMPYEVNDYSPQQEEITNVILVARSFVGAVDPSTGNNYPKLIKSNGEQVYSLSDMDYANVNNADAVYKILTNVNNSQLLFDLVPVALSDSLSNSNDLLDFTFINLNDVNVYYQYLGATEGVYNFDNRFSDNDIELVSNLLREVALYLSGEKSSIPDFENMGNLDFDGFNYLLDEIASSPIFHTSGPLYSIDRETGEKYDVTEYTLYQDLYAEILLNSNLVDFIFNNQNPKDIYNSDTALYTNANEKVVYILNNYINNDISLSTLSEYNQETVDILKSIVGDGTASYPGLGLNGLDFNSIDINSIDKQALKQVLTSINDSHLFYDYAPNLLNFVLQKVELTGANYIDLNDVNIYYQYLITNNNEGFDFTVRYNQDDIDLIIDMIDKMSGDESIIPDFDNLNNIDYEGFEQLLNDFASSNFFHKGGLVYSVIDDNIVYTSEHTVYQEIYLEILLHDNLKQFLFDTANPKDAYYSSIGLYTDASSKANKIIEDNLSIEEKITNLEIINNDTVNILLSILGDDTSLNPGIGIDGLDFNIIDINSINSAQLEQALIYINDSNVFMDFAPNLLKEIFTKANESVSSPDMINFSYINEYYHYGNSTDLDYSARYKEEDFSLITYMIDLVQEKGDSLSSSFNDLDSIDVSMFKDLLKRTNESFLSHRGGPKDSYEITFFQNILSNIYSMDELSSYIYNENSPKDIANASLYTSSTQKAQYIVSSLMNYDGSGLSLDTQAGEFGVYDVYDESGNLIEDGSYGEIGLLASFIEEAKELSTINFDDPNFDLSSIEGDNVASLLNALNNTNTLYDCVPNIIYSFSTAIDGELNNEDVKFSDGSPYFVYEYYSSETNYSSRYPIVEINRMGDIVNDLNEIKVRLDGFNGDFTNIDLTAIDDETVDLIESFTSNLYNSFVYHKYNQYLLDEVKGTVFEQFVISIADSSKMTSLLYRDYSPKDVNYANALDKMFDKVKTMTSVDENKQSPFGRHSNWTDEITALFDLMKDAKNMLEEGDTFDNISLDTISPTQIRTFLIDLNNIDILSDCVDGYVYDGFKDLDFQKVSTYKERDYNNYFLTQEEYYNRDTLSGEIINLTTLFEEFAVYDEQGVFLNYKDFNVDDYTDSSTNFVPIFEYLDKSYIYRGEYENIEARGVFMYNVYDKFSVTQYISGSDELEKMRLLSNLFSVDGFNGSAEGYAINNLLVSIENFSTDSFDPTVFNDVYVAAGVITSTTKYSYDAFNDDSNIRSYFASDLIGNIITDMLEAEYSNLDAHNIEYRKIQNLVPTNIDHIDENTYSRLNEYEKNGIQGAISLINMINHPENIEEEVFKYDFELMGMNNDDGLSANSGYGNSQIATIYYLSKVYADELYDLPLNDEYKPTFVDIVDSSSPYFYFEDFGVKLYDNIFKNFSSISG